MYRAVLKKFQTYPKLKAMLLETGEAEIIENAPHDDEWGCGPDGGGFNRQGKILMRVRAALR